MRVQGLFSVIFSFLFHSHCSLCQANKYQLDDSHKIQMPCSTTVILHTEQLFCCYRFTLTIRFTLTFFFLLLRAENSHCQLNRILFNSVKGCPLKREYFLN